MPAGGGRGPSGSVSFDGLHGCPAVFVSVAVEQIDLTIDDPAENVVVKVSSDLGDRYGDCVYNDRIASVGGGHSACNSYLWAMCSRDFTGLIAPSTSLHVEVRTSGLVGYEACAGNFLNAVVTVECGAASVMNCEDDVPASAPNGLCAGLPSPPPPPQSPSPPFPPPPPAPAPVLAPTARMVKPWELVESLGVTWKLARAMIPTQRSDGTWEFDKSVTSWSLCCKCCSA